MKKVMGLGLVGAIAAASLPIQVNAAAMPEYTPAEKNYFNGAYIGVGVNLLALQKKLNLNIDEIDETPVGIKTTTRGGQHSVGGNIFLGYGATFNSFYLGGEIFGIYAPADEYTFEGEAAIIDPSDHLVKKGKVETDGSWGGLIRLGYLASPKTIIYLLIGAESTKFDITNQYIIPYAGLLEQNTDKFNKTKVAVMPGVGIETMLGDNVSVRAQYSYSFYGDLKKTIKVMQPEVTASNSEVEVGEYTMKVSPNRSNFSVDLIYQFS